MAAVLELRVTETEHVTELWCLWFYTRALFVSGIAVLAVAVWTGGGWAHSPEALQFSTPIWSVWGLCVRRSIIHLQCVGPKARVLCFPVGFFGEMLVNAALKPTNSFLIKLISRVVKIEEKAAEMTSSVNLFSQKQNDMGPRWLGCYLWCAEDPVSQST